MKHYFTNNDGTFEFDLPEATSWSIRIKEHGFVASTALSGCVSYYATSKNLIEPIDYPEDGTSDEEYHEFQNRIGKSLYTVDYSRFGTDEYHLTHGLTGYASVHSIRDSITIR